MRQGRVFDLAHVLDEHIPAFPGRTFRQQLSAPEGLDTANDVHWVVEYVNATGLNRAIRTWTGPGRPEVR